jgi:hemolysin III
MSFLDFREPVSAWSHCAGLLLAVPGTLMLWRRSAGGGTKRLTLLVYGLTLAFCYLASTLYHGVRVSAAGVAMYDRLDRVGIFALIAGSYTPLAWCLLRGHWRRWTLLLVWGVAGTAAVMLVAGRLPSPATATCVYLAMGWGVVACYFEFANALSHRAMLPIVVGGLSYSVGAVLNVLHWPVIVPGTFGAHELFHFFVLAGSLAHYLFMLKIAAPLGTAACAAAALTQVDKCAPRCHERASSVPGAAG